MWVFKINKSVFKLELSFFIQVLNERRAWDFCSSKFFLRKSWKKLTAFSEIIRVLKMIVSNLLNASRSFFNYSKINERFYCLCCYWNRIFSNQWSSIFWRTTIDLLKGKTGLKDTSGFSEILKAKSLSTKWIEIKPFQGLMIVINPLILGNKFSQ